jgi:hypothetical protein
MLTTIAPQRVQPVANRFPFDVRSNYCILHYSSDDKEVFL